MKISSCGGACLTVEEPGELCAVAEEKLDLETRNIEVYQFMTIQLRISRAQTMKRGLAGSFRLRRTTRRKRR